MAASKAARGRRPPRLAIPAPMACAPGVDPFGAVADLEAEVATELEVQGEGFCLASRRGVRHAMEDGYGVITDHTVQGASQLVCTSYIITSI
jgi:protein phosphatase 1L